MDQHLFKFLIPMGGNEIAAMMMSRALMAVGFLIPMGGNEPIRRPSVMATRVKFLIPMGGNEQSKASVSESTTASVPDPHGGNEYQGGTWDGTAYACS